MKEYIPDTELMMHCASLSYTFSSGLPLLPSSANTLASRSVVAVSTGPPPVLNRSILSSAAVFFEPFLMLLYAYCAQLKPHTQITISIARLIYMQSNVLATLDIAPLITVARQTDLTSFKKYLWISLQSTNWPRHLDLKVVWESHHRMCPGVPLCQVSSYSAFPFSI